MLLESDSRSLEIFPDLQKIILLDRIKQFFFLLYREQIERMQSNLKGVWIVAIAGLLLLYTYAIRVVLSTMVGDLISYYRVDALDISFLGVIYLVLYSVGQIPAGAIIDRFGIRLVLVLSAILNSIGSILFILCHKFWLAQIGYGLIGIGSLSVLIACLKLASYWFSARYLALVTSLVITLAMIGGVIGQAPVVLLNRLVGWQGSFFWFAVIAFFLAILILLFVSEKDAPFYMNKVSLKHDKRTTFGTILRRICSRQIIIISIYGGLMFGPILVFTSLWGPRFLEVSAYLSPAVAAVIISMIFLAWAIGGPILARFSDQFERRRPFLISSALICLILVSCLVYCHIRSPFILGCLFFLYGFCCSGFAISYASITEISSPSNRGLSLGFMNTVNMLGAIILQPLIGGILDKWQLPDLQNTGSHLFSFKGYQIAFSLFVVSYLIAALLSFLIKESFPSSSKVSLDLISNKRSEGKELS